MKRIESSDHCEDDRYHTLLKGIWGEPGIHQRTLKDHKAIAQYYHTTLSINIDDYHWKNEHLITTIDIIRDGFSCDSRSTLQKQLQLKLDLISQSTPSESEINELIILSVKIWTFIDVRYWRPDETLQAFIEERFRPRLLDKQDIRFPSSFNLRNLSHLAGIETQWTNDLTEHLTVCGDDDSKVYVRIFHLASVLSLYEGSDMMPATLQTIATETLETLSLLVPCHDRRVHSWLRTCAMTEETLDAQVSSQVYMRLSERYSERFNIWREKLLILKDIYDEREPKGIVRFWRDDRRPIQWWTFWIAVLVFLFTIIQCIESALQVYKAYYPAPSPD